MWGFPVPSCAVGCVGSQTIFSSLLLGPSCHSPVPFLLCYRCLCIVCVQCHVWISEDNFWEPALSLLHRDGTRVIRRGSRCPYLSHLTGPESSFTNHVHPFLCFSSHSIVSHSDFLRIVLLSCVLYLLLFLD